MKKKIILSTLVILAVVAASLGATMAWFTDESEDIENVFTAGTVIIEADETWEYVGIRGNWNPGDCDDKLITVTNVGTKCILLRAEIEQTWYLRYEVDGDGEFVLDSDGERIEYIGPWTVGEENNPAAWTAPTILNDDIDNVTWWNGDKTIPGNEWPGNPEKWFFVDDHSAAADGYWYYFNKLPVESTPVEITFITEVCLDGELTVNKYQGATYIMNITFEAIQCSNEASNDLWDVVSNYDADGKWNSWGAPIN